MTTAPKHHSSALNLNLAATTLDNSAAFESPFFRRFQASTVSKALTLSDKVEKEYLFPTLYGNVTSAVALYTCSYEEADRLLRDAGLMPLNLGLGRAVLAVSSYHYKNVRGLLPYGEIAISIPVVPRGGANLPLVPLLPFASEKLGVYVVAMPVTSLENQIRGEKIWGLPKVVMDIAIVEKDGKVVTKAVDRNGKTFLEFSVPARGKIKDVDESYLLYSKLANQDLAATSSSKGRFAITTDLSALLAKGRGNSSELIWGASEMPNQLAKLDVAPRPFRTQFGVGIESAFEYPKPR